MYKLAFNTKPTETAGINAFCGTRRKLTAKLRPNKLKIGTFRVSLPPFFPTPLPPSLLLLLLLLPPKPVYISSLHLCRASIAAYRCIGSEWVTQVVSFLVLPIFGALA